MDEAISQYVEVHKGAAENSYLYQGAFAVGVKRAKVSRWSRAPDREPWARTFDGPCVRSSAGRSLTEGSCTAPRV